MQRRAFVAGVGAAALGGCGDPRKVVDLRVRCTLSVIADGIVRTAANVIRTRWQDMHGVPLHMERFETKHWQEAPWVDLGAHGLLFATFKNEEQTPGVGRMQMLPPLFYPRQLWPDKDHFVALQELAASRWKISLQRPYLPVFVRFRDPRDPTTVEQVAPHRLQDTYDDRVSLREFTLEVTDAEPTETIRRVLPWLERHEGNLANGEHYVRPRGPVGERLGVTDFRQWGW